MGGLGGLWTMGGLRTGNMRILLSLDHTIANNHQPIHLQHIPAWDLLVYKKLTIYQPEWKILAAVQGPGSGAGRWPSIPSEGCVNVCMWVGWGVWGGGWEGGWGGWEGGWAGQVDRFPSPLRDVWTCACHRQAGFCKTGKKGSTVLKQPTMDDGWNTDWDSRLKTISRKMPKCE